MNFITLKELKKMVPVASEFKRVPGLKKILEDGIEVILRKQMENHAEVVVYKMDMFPTMHTKDIRCLHFITVHTTTMNRREMSIRQFHITI